jgi:ABC-2 type transport system permease protein
VCLVAGFRPHAGTGALLGFVFMTLIAVVFAALRTIIGSALRDMQGFQLIMNFLVMPIFFLSGALYPLSNLPAALAVATRLDPLSYGVDGLRGAFIDQSYFGVPTDLAVLVALATLFLALGARAFSRIQV